MSEQRSFEELQRELDDIVAKLERGDVPLDEALALWRRGEELHRALRRAARPRPSSRSRSCGSGDGSGRDSETPGG